MPASTWERSLCTNVMPRQGKLTARIYAMIGGTGADFDAISKSGPLIGYGNDYLTVRSVKLYADGALGSRGAALLAPYSDEPGNSGLLFNTPDALTAMIGKALGKGYQVAYTPSATRPTPKCWTDSRRPTASMAARSCVTVSSTRRWYRCPIFRVLSR